MKYSGRIDFFVSLHKFKRTIMSISSLCIWVCLCRHDFDDTFDEVKNIIPEVYENAIYFSLVRFEWQQSIVFRFFSASVHDIKTGNCWRKRKSKWENWKKKKKQKNEKKTEIFNPNGFFSSLGFSPFTSIWLISTASWFQMVHVSVVIISFSLEIKIKSYQVAQFAGGRTNIVTSPVMSSCLAFFVFSFSYNKTIKMNKDTNEISTCQKTGQKTTGNKIVKQKKKNEMTTKTTFAFN